MEKKKAQPHQLVAASPKHACDPLVRLSRPSNRTTGHVRTLRGRSPSHRRPPGQTALVRCWPAPLSRLLTYTSSQCVARRAHARWRPRRPSASSSAAGRSPRRRSRMAGSGTGRRRAAAPRRGWLRAAAVGSQRGAQERSGSTTVLACCHLMHTRRCAWQRRLCRGRSPRRARARVRARLLQLDQARARAACAARGASHAPLPPRRKFLAQARRGGQGAHAAWRVGERLQTHFANAWSQLLDSERPPAAPHAMECAPLG